MDKIILGAAYLSKALLYGCFVYILLLVIMKVTKCRNQFIPKTQNFIELISIVYLVMLIQVTGISDFMSWHFTLSGTFNWVPFINEDAGLIVLNILLFVPMGFLIPSLFSINWNYIKIILLGIGSSLLIELTQLFLVGRTADIDDILANTSGCIIGCFIFRIARIIYKNMNCGKTVGVGTVSGALSTITLFFCIPLGKICLGDILLIQLSIPVWSGDTENVYSMEGIHYTLIIGLVIEVLTIVLTKRYSMDFGAKVNFKISIAAIVVIIILIILGF